MPSAALPSLDDTAATGLDELGLADRGSELPTIVLASGRTARERVQIRPQRVALALGSAALVLLVLVGLGGAWVSRQVAQRQAVHDVAERTDLLAQSVLQPALTDAMQNDPVAATAALDALVRGTVLSDSLVRVKLWTPDGQVLYSDEGQLIGRTFPLDAEARRALTVPQTDASVSDLDRPENQFERAQGTLLEVYRPVWTPGGHPLLFETYFRYDIVTDRSAGLWRGFAGIIASALIALLLLLSPIVWSLLRRTQRAQARQADLARRALASSDDERARIAGSLHDGVVQDLIASALQLAGQAQRAAAGDPQRSADLNHAATTVRASVAGLRSLLVEIYPPELAGAGLATALDDVIGPLNRGATAISLDLDDDSVARLPVPAAEAVLRVAQEAVRNAIKHAAAVRVTVRIAAAADVVVLEVDDDGSGFDVTSVNVADRARGGHLGLRLMADAAETVGARLRVASAPGSGTHWRMEVPAP